MQRRESQKRIDQYMTSSTGDHLVEVEIKGTYNHIFQKAIATYGICQSWPPPLYLEGIRIEALFGDFYSINVNRQKNHTDD